MLSTKFVRFLLPLTLAVTIELPIQAQDVDLSDIESNTSETNQSEDPTDPSNVRPSSQSSGLLSMQGGEELLAQAEAAINSQEYEIAATNLQKARQVFNQLTNFYLQLANSFSGIDTRIYETQRSVAAQTGQMRDEATYKLALVHRAQNQPELAIPLLIQVIRSQNPTSELGKKSYQQLYELGFVDTPYSTSNR